MQTQVRGTASHARRPTGTLLAQDRTQNLSAGSTTPALCKSQDALFNKSLVMSGLSKRFPDRQVKVSMARPSSHLTPHLLRPESEGESPEERESLRRERV